MVLVTPAWEAATSGFKSNAGQANQFLGVHQSTFLYSGASIVSSQATGSGVYSSTQGTWFSQNFTTTVSQTVMGSVQLQISTVGGSPTLALIPSLSVGIYALSSLGVPTGAALASVTVNNSYVYSAPFWVSIPLPVTGLSTSTTYAIVTQAVGSSTNYYAWQHSNQTSGCKTSPDGVNWTSQAFGLMYRILDQTVSGNLQMLYEDGGARWVQFSYNASGSLASVIEHTSGQSTSGYLQSSRSLTYTNGLLTGIS